MPTPENTLDPAQPDVPIDASGSVSTIVIRNLLIQLITAVGVLIGVLGLGENTMIVKLYRFLVSDQAVPIIGVVAAFAGVVYQQIRSIRKHRALQTLALLPTTPDSVAIGPAAPTSAVAKAVLAAEVKIGDERAANLDAKRPMPPADED